MTQLRITQLQYPLPRTSVAAALELELPALVVLEHRARAGPERSVVEEQHIGVQQELLSEVGRHV